MSTSISDLSIQIGETIEQLHRLSQVDVLAHWFYCSEDLPITWTLTSEPWQILPIATLNDQGHITWQSGCQELWLFQKLVVPQDLQGYSPAGLSLRLILTWWAEDAQIFVNGKLVHRGDLFDASIRLLLSESVTITDEFLVGIRLVSPSHDRGALTRSLCLFSRDDGDFLTPAPSLVADELAVLQTYFTTLAPAKLDLLAVAITQIDWTALPDRVLFERSLVLLRQKLLELVQEFPLKQREIFLLGHAHLDLAWLWPVSETWSAAQRTFTSVLQLQQDFSDLIFCHTTPALYAWIEANRPDLFAAIKESVTNGRWELVGGMWVEPDLNLIDGESICRQILYGQRYIQAKFGQLMTVAWLPDSFGFCWQLPQLLSQGGIEYFVTQKLCWNDTNKFPHGAFWWRSPDGSQIFSLMSALIGTDTDPVKMANYACEWEQQTNLLSALWLPGVGDCGGGPSRDMLEVARVWQHSPFFPQVSYSTAAAYLQKIKTTLTCDRDPQDVPVWDSELYLEFHRGCYTTHAEQKRWNRYSEGLLYQAELFASLVTLLTGDSYPHQELETAWQKMLFNQFHDILPGSAIPQVYRDADQDWFIVKQIGLQILNQSLLAIANLVTLPSPPTLAAIPIVVFNPLNWERSAVVTIQLPPAIPSQHWIVSDATGTILLSQLFNENTLLFRAIGVPSIGYRVFWIYPQPSETLGISLDQGEFTEKRTEIRQYNISSPLDYQTLAKKSILPTKDWILENELLRVIVDGETGNISSMFDQIEEREICGEGGCNQLQVFADSGQYWDAWNIDPNYEQHPLPAPRVTDIFWVETGPIQWRLRIIRQLAESEFCQDYILESGSPILKIATTVDWRSRHQLVKAAFNFTVKSDIATYEIPVGAIARSTSPTTTADQAKWEVPALRWADLSDEHYGVSILNDCKYGYDAKPNQLRLTLLRSPIWPDPEADQGKHEFAYGIYPHGGNWKKAKTVHRGYEFNFPLQPIALPENLPTKTSPNLPLLGKLLDLQGENLILMALKQAETDPQRWVLRCYEWVGEATQLKLGGEVGLVIDEAIDILERSVTAVTLPNSEFWPIAPWKISSFAVLSPIAIST